MKNPAKTAKLCALLHALALGWAGCSKYSVVGTSGVAPGSDGSPPTSASDTPSVASKPQPVKKTTTGIVSEPNRRIYGNRVLGDLDGDGYDDFVVLGEQHVSPGSLDSSLETAVHLFYGRPAFPAQLSTAQADATFVGCLLEPIGDVNGDDLADFSFTDQRGTRLVFGSADRIGDLADLDRHAPVVWDAETDPSRTRETWVHRAGDVNGDDFDDLLVMFSFYAHDERTGDFTMTNGTYLVWGRASGWPLGRFEPDWADAVLDADGAVGFEILPVPAGAASDLDADGFADLFGVRRGTISLVLFYGSPNRFSTDPSTLVPDLEWPLSAGELMPIGDLDGDGYIDLVSFRDQTTGIVAVHYGGPTRWTDQVELIADLEVTSPYHLAPQVGSGDIDGDSIADLVVSAPLFGEPNATGALLVLRGTGERLVGRHSVAAMDVLMAAPPLTPSPRLRDEIPTALFGGEIDMSGDIDGDGSKDVLVGAPGLTSPGDASSQGGAYLIPSTPSTPQ